MRLVQFLPVLPVLVWAACGDAPAPLRKTTRDERLEQLSGELALARSNALPEDAHARLVDTVSGILADADTEGPWIGLDGWSLRKGELNSFLRWNAGTPQPADTALETIVAYARAFEERGIDFLVVPVPGRLAVYSDRLPGVERTQASERPDRGELAALSTLAESGVEVVDLVPLFRAHLAAGGRPLYFDYNPHWNPTGASLAADAIADRIRSMPWFDPTPEPGVAFERGIQRKPFDVPSTPPEGEEPVDAWFERILDAQGEPAYRKRRGSEILVLGDSFAKIFRTEGADFVANLYARLERRFDEITIMGGAADAVWKSLERRGDGLAGKKLVLWVFTAKVLDEPMEAVQLFAE